MRIDRLVDVLMFGLDYVAREAYMVLGSFFFFPTRLRVFVIDYIFVCRQSSLVFVCSVVRTPPLKWPVARDRTGSEPMGRTRRELHRARDASREQSLWLQDIQTVDVRRPNSCFWTFLNSHRGEGLLLCLLLHLRSQRNHTGVTGSQSGWLSFPEDLGKRYY